MYVAVKGGEGAIANAHRLLAEDRRGDPGVPELTIEQIEGQLTLAVDRVMIEGSCYDRRLAALAISRRAVTCRRRSSSCAPIAPRCPASASRCRSIPEP